MVLALGCVATLVSRSSQGPTAARPGAVPIPGSTQIVRPIAHRDIDADGILGRLVRGDGDSPGREQIEALARNSVRASEQLLERNARRSGRALAIPYASR